MIALVPSQSVLVRLLGLRPPFGECDIGLGAFGSRLKRLIVGIGLLYCHFFSVPYRYRAN